jgi:hypothetical protein
MEGGIRGIELDRAAVGLHGGGFVSFPVQRLTEIERGRVVIGKELLRVPIAGNRFLPSLEQRERASAIEVIGPSRRQQRNRAVEVRECFRRTVQAHQHLAEIAV